MSKFFDMAPNYKDLYGNILSDSSSNSSSTQNESDSDSNPDLAEDMFKLSKSYRKVSFYSVVFVVCIPTRHEYKDFFNELWYSKQDFQRFRLNYFYNRDDHTSSSMPASSSSDVCSPS